MVAAIAGAATSDARMGQRIAVAARARDLVRAAALTPAYGDALTAALALPGNILSHDPDACWARIVLTCRTAAGGRWEQAVPIAAAVELFMVALDLLDDAEDCEENAIQASLGLARALNVSTGLLFLAHQGLLDAAEGSAMRILLAAGLRACGSQDADLTSTTDRPATLSTAMDISAGKSATLVAAICRLGALCAGADETVQDIYARFGWHVGLVKQLANDIAGIRPAAVGKTDRALGRPTLPLTYAALYPSASGFGPSPHLSDGGPTYLTWAVADAYRRRALALIPQMTADDDAQASLAALLDVL